MRSIHARYLAVVLLGAAWTSACGFVPELEEVADVSKFGECASEGVVVAVGEPHPYQSCEVCGAGLDFVPCLFGCEGDVCRRPLKVSAGADHTCALIAGGDIYCWGNNTVGQVGNGAVGQPATNIEKVALPFGATATDIVAGTRQTCALTTFGQVFCWGAIQWVDGVGYQGSECADVKEATGVPTLMTCINNEGPASAIAHHNAGMCALILDKGLFCLTETLREPVKAEGALASYELGSEALCVLTDDGGVHCTGRGPVLGLGPDEDGTVTVALPEPAVGVSIGNHHACAWSGTGEAWCWGANKAGELPGVMIDEEVSPLAPIPLNADEFVERVVTGSGHTCAASVAAAARCWGPSPAAGVEGAEWSSAPWPVMSLSARGEHTCIIGPRGVIWCWGKNPDGRLGANYLLDSVVPVPVLIPNQLKVPR